MNQPHFYFEEGKLRNLAEKYRDTYVNAEPFPHAVLDDFLPSEVATQLLAEFPAPDTIAWNQYKHPENENLKLSNEKETLMGPYTRHVLGVLNSSTFVEFLEKLTGIDGLIPDPHFRGGGLHQTLSGGHLGVHIDFNTYKRLGIYRRLNILIYLNKDWQESWGGHLELWSNDGKKCVKSIAPLFNRMALFSTGEHSYHGHPHSLQTPRGVTRKSIALYYYTAVPGEGGSAMAHTTIFPHAKSAGLLKRCIPPIVLDALRVLRRRKENGHVQHG